MDVEIVFILLYNLIFSAHKINRLSHMSKEKGRTEVNTNIGDEIQLI